MSNRVEFKDDRRYATDCGPQCVNKCSGDEDTFWVYLFQYPYERAIGMSGCCQDVVNFAVWSEGDTNMEASTTIKQIKEAHRRYLDRKRQILSSAMR